MTRALKSKMNAHQTNQRGARKTETRVLLGGRIQRSFVVKTGFRSLSLVPIAAAMLLSMSSIGCVVAATGTDTSDEKSQTQELDTTDTTATAISDAPKLPNYEAAKAGGQGGGPDPSPWRVSEEAANGGTNGPDPSPWDVNPNTSATKSK
jgi:hypothetical protein